MTAAETRKAPRRAPPLAGARLLAQFGVVLGAALAAVFPTQSEYADIAAAATPNAYSIAYLKVLTRADPKDMHLRMLYARHLAALGQWDEALAAVQPVLSDAALGGDASDFRLDVLLSRARAIPEDNPARKLAFHDVEVALEQMADKPERKGKLAEYAKTALELEAPKLAARFYARAADADPKRRTEYLELAGKWHRASGDEVTASDMYEQAARSTSDAIRAEADTALAIDGLQGASRVADAYRLARQALDRYGDRRMLERTIALASAAGDVTTARELGRKLLAQSPDDPGLIEAQARRELWAGDPASALPLIQRVRQLQPENAAVRELEAHVAEWSGRPELALDDWLWLLQHGHAISGRAP